MHDITTTRRLREEGLLPVVEACRLVPSERGQKRHVSRGTMLRWILTGKLGIRLEATRQGGDAWYTSQGALDRFFDAIRERELARYNVW
jgi:hypothetical protein